MDEFAALADPTRRQIIEKLARQGSLTATEIAVQFPVSAQAISQQLKILRESKMVQMEKRAQQRIYHLNPETLHKLEVWAKQITTLWEERFSSLSELIEEEKRKVGKNRVGKKEKRNEPK
jgi:DNA-binding transcriptional ArsR family regulator